MLRQLLNILGFILISIISNVWAGSIAEDLEKINTTYDETIKKDSGFSLLEIDLLHKDIQERLVYLKSKKDIKKDENNQLFFDFFIGDGALLKSPVLYYHYKSNAYISIKEDGSLQSIRIRFDMINLKSKNFEEERREMINNTPYVSIENGVLDRNDDISFTYYKDTSTQEPNFQLVRSLQVKDILYYSKQAELMYAYLKYLKVLHHVVVSEYQQYQANDKYSIGKMIDIR